MSDSGLLSDEDVGLGSGAAPEPAAASPPSLLSDDDVGLGASPQGSAAPSASGPLSNSENDGWLSSAAKGIGTAAIKGLSNSIGAVGNLGNLADYLVARGESAITGEPLDTVWAKQQARTAQFAKDNPTLASLDPTKALPTGQQVAAPILQKTGEYVPEGEAGKLGMAGVEAAASMFGPGGGRVAPGASLAQAAVKAPLAAAPGNIAAGSVGQGVTDVTGDPLLGMAAGTGAAGVAGAASDIAGKVARPFAEDLPVVGRQFQGQRDQMVGEGLQKAASNPDAVDRALNPGPLQPGAEPNYQTVPGSQPTLGQLTNDQGILQAERKAKTTDNSAFNLREGEQNAAQLGAISGAAPADADVMKPSQLFQSQLDHIDNSTQQALDQLSQRAQGLAAGLGPGATPEANGAAIRNGIETARAAAKDVRRQAYDAVDPDQSLNIVASPVREAGARIAGDVGQYSAQPVGEEAGVLAAAKTLPDVMKFRDLGDFDQRVTAAMRAEKMASGESPAWRRLSMLNGAVKDAINNAVDNQAEFERQAVARGEISPNLAMEARLRQQWNVPDATNLRRNAEGYIQGNFGTSPGSSSRSAGSGRADVPPGGGFPQAQGDQGIPPAALEPNFDQDAADRLAAAKQSHIDYARTYKEGPVAPAIKTRGFADNFTTPASGVPAKVIVSGDQGYQTAKSFLTAAKNDPATIQAMQDHALSPLRRGLLPDGSLNPKAFSKWKQDYSGSLRALDEATPGFSGRFSNAAKATDAMVQAGTQRKLALDAFQQSQAAKFLGKTSPEEVQNQIGAVFGNKRDGATNMRALVKQVGKDQASLDGLRKAGVDWITRNFSNAAEAPGTGQKLLSGAKFQKFVRDNAATLKELYPENQVNAFRAVADDMERADRSVSATRIKGSPGSAKDLASVVTKKIGEVGHHVSLMNAIQLGVLGGLEEHGMRGALIGGAGAGAAYYLNSLRAAGLDKVQNAFRDALLNPDRARFYLSKVPSQKGPNPALAALAGAVRRSAITTPIFNAEADQTTEPPPLTIHRAAGGRVAVDRSPTEAQKAVGNYLKHHMRLHGLDITIENPKDSFRSGAEANGKKWRCKIPHHYGYIRGTTGADGDHVDCYVGPDEGSEQAFIVDQKDLSTGKFDEHKVMLGFKSREAALMGYRNGFSDGRGHARIMKVTPMSIDGFKKWLREADMRKAVQRVA